MSPRAWRNAEQHRRWAVAGFRDLQDWIFRYPRVYLAAQKILGADRIRRRCVEVLDPRPGERILDLGCGVGYVRDYLPSVTYYGFDSNARYIDYATSRFAGRGHFYCEDLADRHLDALRPIDGALLMGLLHHVSDETARALIDLVCRALAPHGRMVTVDPCLEEGGSRIARYMAASDRGRYVRDRRGYLGLVNQRFTTTEAVLWRNGYRVPSSEIVMRCTGPLHAPDAALSRR